MSSTASQTTALSTLTSPMTTIWTPPSSCATRWTYEPQARNSVTGGLLLQNALYKEPDTSCQPSGFDGWGRAPSFIQVFSPGACPSGYTTAVQSLNGETTTEVCCPSSFGYTNFVSSINAGSKTAQYFGCTSFFTNPYGTTTVWGEEGVSQNYESTSDGTATVFTTLTSSVTMWAQPITVAYQQKDLSLFATSTSSTQSTTATSSPGPTTSSLASITAASTVPSASNNATTTSSPVSSSNSSLDTSSMHDSGSHVSSGDIAGIAIGAAAVVGLLIGAAIFFRQKQKGPPSTGSAVPLHEREQDQGPWWHSRAAETAKPPYYQRETTQDSQGQHGYAGAWQQEQSNGMSELSTHEDRRYELS